jgi:hypothetical protein
MATRSSTNSGLNLTSQDLAMPSKPPHPYYLFTEFLSDLQFLLKDIREIIEWAGQEIDDRRKRHLARLAIVYMAFAAKALIDLCASAGRMTKQFNDFHSKAAPEATLRYPVRGQKKRLIAIMDRLKPARNLIAHPFRIEVDGRDFPMNLLHALRLDFVTGDVGQLAVEVKEMREVFRDLRDWHSKAFVAGATRTDWLGGGKFEIDF